MEGDLAERAADACSRPMVGFVASVVFGLLLGALVGISPELYRCLSPLLVAFNSVPKVAVVPGSRASGMASARFPAVLTAFLISFFPIVVNVAAGIAMMEPELADVLRSLGASRLRNPDEGRHSALAALLLRFAERSRSRWLSLASVISETVAANDGIGYLMMAASSSFRIPLVFAALLVVAFMGVAMYAIAAWMRASGSRIGRCAMKAPTPTYATGG